MTRWSTLAICALVWFLALGGCPPAFDDLETLTGDEQTTGVVDEMGTSGQLAATDGGEEVADEFSPADEPTSPADPERDSEQTAPGSSDGVSNGQSPGDGGDGASPEPPAADGGVPDEPVQTPDGSGGDDSDDSPADEGDEPDPDVDGDVPINRTTPGDGGGGRGDEPGTLTPAQAEAVDFVVRQFVAAASVFGACSTLGDSQLDLRPEWGDAYGECPRVAFVSGTDRAAICVDFGESGCSSAVTAGEVVSGALDIWFWRNTETTDMTPRDLVFDGAPITGYIDTSLESMPTGVRMDGPCSITTWYVGTADGSVTLDINRDGQLTFVAAYLVLEDDSASTFTSAKDVVVDAVQNTSFVPEDGTLTFRMDSVDPPDTSELVVTFTVQSPIDGTVLVSVDGATPVEYRVELDEP